MRSRGVSGGSDGVIELSVFYNRSRGVARFNNILLLLYGGAPRLHLQSAFTHARNLRGGGGRQSAGARRQFADAHKLRVHCEQRNRRSFKNIWEFANGTYERDRDRDARCQQCSRVHELGLARQIVASTQAHNYAQRVKRRAHLVLKTQTLSTKFTNMVAAVTLPTVLASAGARANLHFGGNDALVHQICEDGCDRDVVNSAFVKQAHEHDRDRDLAKSETMRSHANACIHDATEFSNAPRAKNVAHSV